MRRKKYKMGVDVTAIFVGLDDDDEEQQQYLYEMLLRAENAANSIVSNAISGSKRCSVRLHFQDVVPGK